MCRLSGLLPLILTVSKKLTLVHEGLVPLHQEFTELLTKMCSFSQNMGLLPLILTVSKNYS